MQDLFQLHFQLSKTKEALLTEFWFNLKVNLFMTNAFTSSIVALNLSIFSFLTSSGSLLPINTPNERLWVDFSNYKNKKIYLKY